MEAPDCRSSRRSRLQWASPEQLQGEHGHCSVARQGTATGSLSRSVLPKAAPAPGSSAGKTKCLSSLSALPGHGSGINP